MGDSLLSSQFKRTHFQETRNSNIKHFHRIKARINTILNAGKDITISLIKKMKKYNKTLVNKV